MRVRGVDTRSKWKVRSDLFLMFDVVSEMKWIDGILSDLRALGGQLRRIGLNRRKEGRLRNDNNLGEVSKFQARLIKIDNEP